MHTANVCNHLQMAGLALCRHLCMVQANVSRGVMGVCFLGRTKKMGFKNLKYGDGRWFFVRAIMDEHLHKLLDRSYHVKEFKKTEFVGEASAGFTWNFKKAQIRVLRSIRSSM